ncbi:MAG: hypothetical protein NC311_14050 [Muribaculaceae bacterium]|nr:hypothetical protein [Muribaculaceae bacterium]
MKGKNRNKSNSMQQAHMVIDGHNVTISFSEQYNPALAPLLKETLIDAFLRQRSAYTASMPENAVQLSGIS